MKTLFITGATGDIGKAIVKIFKSKQYHIIAPNRKELNLEDPNSIQNYLNKIKLQADILIHCAGFNQPKSWQEIDLKDIEKTININTISFFQITKAFIPYLKKQKKGHILGISSLYGFLARAKRLSYVISKHALNGMIKTLALELGKYNILVNSLSPGFVATKMTLQNNSSQTIKDFEDKIALSRLCKPSEIAETAYFLCSEKNTYITGQNIIVDGGYSIGGFQK